MLGVHCPYLKKGSLIICTGNVEPSPFISKVDNSPKAGLNMTVLDIDLDIIRNVDETSEEAVAEEAGDRELATVS